MSVIIMTGIIMKGIIMVLTIMVSTIVEAIFILCWCLRVYSSCSLLRPKAILLGFRYETLKRMSMIFLTLTEAIISVANEKRLEQI